MATLVSNNKRHPHRTWHGKRERGDKELTMVLLGRWLWSVLGACARQFQLASHHLHRPFLLRARLPSLLSFRSTGEFNWEEKLPGASEESCQGSDSILLCSFWHSRRCMTQVLM
uniref:Uncharacterized protein n=1 Tax=Setaria italica TaxID=4555 RepID=K3ZKD3_SETIT